MKTKISQACFDARVLRLKEQLGVRKELEVAKALGMSPSSLWGRRKRGSFPEVELYALAAKRPDLRLDVDYILTVHGAAADSPVAHQDFCLALKKAMKEEMLKRFDSPEVALDVLLSVIAYADSASLSLQAVIAHFGIYDRMMQS